MLKKTVPGEQDMELELPSGMGDGSYYLFVKEHDGASVEKFVVKGKNKKKGGKSGNPMKREAEEKALRDKLAGKNSGSKSSGSAFARKPQNPALPAGLQDVIGDSGTELPPNFGGGLSGLLH